MQLTNFLLDLIFPNFCLDCGRFNVLLCPACYQKIEFLPLSVQTQLEPCYLDQVVSMAEYQGVIKTLIINLKYQSLKQAGVLLGKMVVETTIFPIPDLVTAIPLSRKRRWQRGFNQAAIIAKQIAQLKQLPYQPLLVRTKHTSPQAKIRDKEKRLTHLQDCFALNPQLSLNLKQNNSLAVLLVDDVLTTGSTLNAGAQVLKTAGFKKVYGLTVAHGS